MISIMPWLETAGEIVSNAVIFRPITCYCNISVLNAHWGVMHAVTFTSKLDVNNIVLMIVGDMVVQVTSRIAYE